MSKKKSRKENTVEGADAVSAPEPVLGCTLSAEESYPYQVAGVGNVTGIRGDTGEVTYVEDEETLKTLLNGDKK